MLIFQVNTKVYNADTGTLIGHSTATVEADDKTQARFFFRHHAIEMNTPKGLKIKGDLRTLKIVQQQQQPSLTGDGEGN